MSAARMNVGLRWRWRFTLDWRTAAIIFGGVGLLLLSFGARFAERRREILRRWPRVVAHVDSARVATPAPRHESVYAPKYWLTYTRDGRTVSTAAARSVYTGDYAAVARAVDGMKRRGTIEVLVNPADPRALELDPGYNGTFFFDAILLTALGLFFAGFGALFAVFGRRLGWNAPAAATFPAPAWLGPWFAGAFGVAFLSGAAIAVYSTEHPLGAWPVVRARVDSADVVERSDRDGTTYAPRVWISYDLHRRAYDAPLESNTSSSSYDAEARRAAAAASARTVTVRVDPHNPYRVQRAIPSFWQRVFLPGVFALLGVACLGLAWLLRRGSSSDSGRSAPRRRRATSAPALS